MLKNFLPRQDNFFIFFQKAAALLTTTATQFHSMLNDLSNCQQYVDAIAELENEGDNIAHTTFELLHKTFITPFDRHDIHQLISGLDDILDDLNRCAQRFPMYHLEQAPEEMVKLAQLSIQASMLLKEAIARLNSLKKSEEILNYCEGIDRIESEAHKVVLEGEKDLFFTENDFKNFFKLKEIYARTKSVINSYQDVANIVKGIVLEYS
jgi:predicted phosphate transport protein (TIGR00153 family)